MGDATCSVNECQARAVTRGWCYMHYRRWWKHGDPLFVVRPDLRGAPEIERFLLSVDAADCWYWTGRRNAYGYGAFSDSAGVRRQAHRWLYEHLVGKIPDGLVIDHLCRVRECVNPDHLEPVTQAVNVQRGQAGANKRTKTACPKGHPYSGTNLYMTSNGGRACRTCTRESQRRRRAVRSGELSVTKG